MATRKKIPLIDENANLEVTGDVQITWGGSAVITFPSSSWTLATIDDLDTAGNLLVLISDIKNNLISTDTDKPLAANQGKILKDFIDNISVLLASDDTTLDELQELVTFIKQNKSDLDSLWIWNIAWLTDALADKASSVHNHNDNYYTKSQMSDFLLAKENTFSKLSAFNRNFWSSVFDVAPWNHTHDDRYYTETEVDNKNFLRFTDTRDVNLQPNQYDWYKVITEFKSATAIWLPVWEWAMLVTYCMWGDYNNAHRQYQVAWASNSQTEYRRHATSWTTWSAWYTNIISNNIGISWADQVINIVSLTQAEYNAATKDASTFYIIT